MTQKNDPAEPEQEKLTTTRRRAFERIADHVREVPGYLHLQDSDLNSMDAESFEGMTDNPEDIWIAAGHLEDAAKLLLALEKCGDDCEGLQDAINVDEGS